MPCGSEHRLIQDPYGRLDDGFRYGDVLVHPHLFRSVLGCQAGIAEYQVRQTHAGAAIAVRGEADSRALAEQLQRALRDLGVPRPQIEITIVPHIERQDTGKIRRFLPL